jgi:hypothetical protein
MMSKEAMNPYLYGVALERSAFRPAVSRSHWPTISDQC